MATSDADDSQSIEIASKKVGLVGGVLAICVMLVSVLGYFVHAEAKTIVRTEVDTVRAELDTKITKHAERPHVGVATKADLKQLRVDIRADNGKQDDMLKLILTEVRK